MTTNPTSNETPVLPDVGLRLAPFVSFFSIRGHSR